jgi:hypothetical protein
MLLHGQVAGKWLKGARLRGGEGTLAERLVGLGYAQVCGQAEVWGDGITPVPSAHLDGTLYSCCPCASDTECSNGQCLHARLDLSQRQHDREARES